MKGNFYNVMTTYSQEDFFVKLIIHFNKIKGNGLSGSQLVNSSQKIKLQLLLIHAS